MQLLEFANNIFTQECVETWGQSLETLSWQEKVYLLDWATLYLGDAELELSTEAEEFAAELEESEECDILQACASLSNTIHNFRGQELNDRAWVLHCGFKQVAEDFDFNSFPNGEGLDEALGAIEQEVIGQSELAETIRGITQIMHEQYVTEIHGDIESYNPAI